MSHINADGPSSDHGEPSESAVVESIRFNEMEEQDGFLIREESTVVNIYPSRSGKKANASRLKIRNLVDYGWDAFEGTGRMLSTHISGKYIAYSVKGAVRVVDLATNERILLKGGKGLTRDVEFVHKMDVLVVGFIDEYGTFFVYKITKDVKTNKLQTCLILNVELDGPIIRLDGRRFVWCKFVPDDENEVDPARDCAYHFAVLQNDMVYVSNLIQIVQRFGEGRHTLQSLRGYYMTIDTHTDSVLDASFAPDGTALATACKDGTVKFFQVYIMGDDPPRCLYSWSPHNGAPVCRILFLDNHSLSSSSDCQYWKYMITAGPNQTDIRLWTCKTWKCLQTLKFNSPMPSSLRLEMDLGANFLIITDVKRKVLFTIHVEHDDQGARFVWIHEFSIPASFLSFNVSEAFLLPFEDILATHEATQLEEFVRSGENSKDHLLCLIGLYFIQSKSLQHGKVIFVPPTTTVEMNGHSPGRISFDRSVSYEDSAGEVSRTPGSDEVAPEEELEEDPAFFLPTKSTMNISLNTKPNSTFTSTPPPKPQARRSMSPSHGQSPKNANAPQTSVTQMTQQLSNLMGLGHEAGAAGAGGLNLGSGTGTGSVRSRTSSAERKHLNKASPDMIQLQTPSPYLTGQTNENANVPIEVRPRTSSMNGNGSNASSSPSREVEEILSPKNTDLIGRRSQTSQSMEGVLNNLDSEGNVLGSEDSSRKHKIRHPMSKGKTASGTEVTPQLPEVIEQVSSILNMMEVQADDMKELKREVSCLNKAQNLAPVQMDEKAFVRILDKYFTSNQTQLRRLEDSVSTILVQDKQRASQTQMIAPNLPDILAEKLGKVLKSEVELRVLPNVMKMFEPTKAYIQAETVKLIQGAEGRIKQEMKQLMSTQNFRDIVTPGIEQSMSSILEGVVAQIFRATIIPNFEKSLQTMFAKINDTFMKGTKEYISGLEATMDMRRSQQDTSQDALKEQFSNLQDHLGSSLQVELETQLLRGMSSLQVGMLKQVEETLARELNRAFIEQQRYLEVAGTPTRTATPAVSLTDQTPSRATIDLPTMRQQVFHLLESGDIVGAFVQASRFGDGPTILEMAERVHPGEVFKPTLPIQTAMSLIQLFVTDIHNHTDIKLQYLHTALGVLNLSQDKRVAASLARIIPIFQLSAKTFLSSYPDSHHIGNLKILEMAFLGHAGHSQLSQQITSPQAPTSSRQKNSSAQQLFGMLKHE